MAEPIELKMRPIPEQLRFWARELANDPHIPAISARIALEMIADELQQQDEEHSRQRKVSAAVRRLLGKQVRVTLATASGGEATIVTGRLLGFGADGEFEIEEPDGVVHYCWPMLSIEEVQ